MRLYVQEHFADAIVAGVVHLDPVELRLSGVFLVVEEVVDAELAASLFGLLFTLVVEDGLDILRSGAIDGKFVHVVLEKSTGVRARDQELYDVFVA